MPPISPVQWMVAGAFGVLLVISVILKYFEWKKNQAKRKIAKKKA